MEDDTEYRRMQVKVLYSFNDNPTVFLSRSTGLYSIQVAQIPSYNSNDNMVMLGGYELKSCIQQILRSSPENFHLLSNDYAVYYKDLTEQPDEPFVSNGVLSELLRNSKSTLVPGRVCQNVSASFLFGNKKESTLTLEIRLKLHTIEKNDSEKRPAEQQVNDQQPAKVQKIDNNPVKATRTKSLPTFQPYNNNMYNIRNADKMTTPSRYDSQSILDRFKLAPFVDAQVIAKPKILRRRYNRNSGLATRSNSMIEPMRASRTRSMVTNRQTPLMISSPIHEEGSSDTDDTEYNEHNHVDDEDEDDYDDDNEHENTSPYTPQQPPYKPKKHEFHSLPDLEDLDSKKTHSIPATRLPDNHGLVCVNPNCITEHSITWRYFEIDFPQNYFEIRTSTEFDKKNYEGMYGPLCNACYLFLRNKGFMRPEAVVKKYLKQQRYKKELKEREERDKKDHKFATPSHTPSEINQAIQNAKFNNQNDLNDFINQLNNYGGPLTDIDPLPQDQGITPPMMATKSNTRVINIEEDKENMPPASPGTEEFEKLIQRSFNKSSPDWMNSLFDGSTGTTPKDRLTPKKRNSPNRIHPGLPQMKTFSTRRSPRLNKTKLMTTTMPSSPLMSSKNNFDAFMDEESLNANLDMIEAHINFKNSSPQPEATRNDTTNLALSLKQGQSSSPSEYFTEDAKTSHINHHLEEETRLNL